jgi:hypothetical protein
VSNIKAAGKRLPWLVLGGAAGPGKGMGKARRRQSEASQLRFPTDTPKTIVANVQCFNRAQAVQTWMAYRAVIAERIQNNKMTVAEGAAAIAQRWSEAQTEMQRRNAYAAAQADAARAAAQQEAIAEENAIRRQNAIAAQQKAEEQRDVCRADSMAGRVGRAGKGRGGAVYGGLRLYDRCGRGWGR